MEDKFRVRDCQMKFWCTEFEREEILNKVRLSGCDNFGDYIRKTAIDGYVINVDYSEMKALAFEINKIGTNINQIAHKINLNPENRIYQTDVDKLLDEVESIWQVLRLKMNQIK